MKEFGSFGAFAAFAGELAVGLAAEQHELLEGIGEAVEARAKEKIGEYQADAGQFAAWAPLAEATKADRVRQGYSEDDPLLRSGDMRDSIHHRVGAAEVEIGSDSDIALYQETGTASIPARSFLGGSLFELAPKIVEAVGEQVTLTLAGGKTGKIEIAR